MPSLNSDDSRQTNRRWPNQKIIAVLSMVSINLMNQGIACAEIYSLPSGPSENQSVYGPNDGQHATDPKSDDDKREANGLNSNDDRLKARQKKAVAILEFTYQALNVFDAVETISCVHKPTCVEGNPILGKKPSNGKIIAFKLAAAGLHYGIYRYMISKSYQQALVFEVGTNAVQGVVCALNLRYAF